MKINLKRSDIYVALTNLSNIYMVGELFSQWEAQKSLQGFKLQHLLILVSTITGCGKLKKNSYKNNKFKIAASTWKDKLELPDGQYSV